MDRRKFISVTLGSLYACGSEKGNPTAPSPVPNNPSPFPPIVGGAVLPGAQLYLDRTSQAADWVRQNPNDPRTFLIRKIAEQPQAVWLTNGNSAETVRSVLAKAGGSVPVFVAYYIPNRDCGAYSAGGAGSTSGYQNWIRSLAGALNGGRWALILEPDALSHDCGNQPERSDLFRVAAQTLPNPESSCYFDAGHPAWQSPAEIADRLRKAGVDLVRGFSLNVSNFETTEACIVYGRQISGLLEGFGLGQKHFVIDVSRNGRGSNGEWCNPSGRALGQPPTTTAPDPLVDALLWIKRPGESDGECNGGPKAGLFWPEYATELVRNANW